MELCLEYIDGGFVEMVLSPASRIMGTPDSNDRTRSSRLALYIKWYWTLKSKNKLKYIIYEQI